MMNTNIGTLGAMALALSVSSVAQAQLPVSAAYAVAISSASSALDECAIPVEMVGHWVSVRMEMLQNSTHLPQMSHLEGNHLTLNCDGTYVEDATGATITAGPDMPPMPAGFAAAECVYLAGGSSGDVLINGSNAMFFYPEHASSVIADQVDCGPGMGLSSFGFHVNAAQNGWMFTAPPSGHEMWLVNSMQSNDAGQIEFWVFYERVTE
jgi:hypothetical protein